MNILPIILAGGVGSRLWPISRELFPKQFLSFSEEASMLQLTIKRAQTITSNLPVVISNDEHRFIVAEQLRQMNLLNKNIILEPKGRNTAPAVALSALHALRSNEDTLLLVLAADHIIRDVKSFQDVVRKSVNYARECKLVTFGVVTDSAETGYGYIHRGHQIDEGVFSIDTFTEKPNLEAATRYHESGEYFWNSGMFMLSARKYIDELEKFNPEMLKVCIAAYDNAEKSGDFIYINKSYIDCPSDSIDYAVMEKTDDGIVIELDAHWSDIGSWSSLWDISDKDNNGNHVRGDVICHGSKSSYIWSESALVVLIDLEGVIVVQTKDAVLVASKDNVQDVKKVVDQLKASGRDEYKCHREVYRPWGRYDSIDFGDRYKVKCITVNPGEELSLQKHHHRSEHWVIVQGTALVTKGTESIYVYENESVYIPIGAVHCLANPGKLPLVLIEVQAGSYLGEDDIVRLNDKYGRNE